MTVETVVKLGGSLVAARCVAPVLAELETRASAGHRLVVVPGGGPFADSVRAVCARLDPGASAAHWMAILGMEQLAHLLVGLTPRARLVRDRAEIEAAIGEQALAVLAPFTWLRAADPLPHGWTVTSDSIAAWVARELGATRLVLLKCVDGIAGPDGRPLRHVSRAGLGRAEEVDRHLARALGPRTSCWLVNGRHPERLRAVLERRRTVATRVR